MTLTWGGVETVFTLSNNAGPVTYFADVGELELRVWKGSISGAYFAEGEWNEWGLDVLPGDTAQEAADALQKAEGHPDLAAPARRFRIYSLCLSSQVEAARRLALQTYPVLARETRLEHWWDFLNDECGIDPR